tara:strand:- start:9052 stop:9828 length:777 start_codon:yes stop_codon:yes gene_type:complete
MKKLTLILFLLTILFISACSKGPIITEESFCKIPYLEYKKGECCLDQNNNILCDTDELNIEKEKLEVEERKLQIEKVKENMTESKKEPEIKEIPKVDEALYNLTEGQSVMFNNVEIKLINLNIGETTITTLEVGGKLTDIFGTRTEDIVGDTKIIINEVFPGINEPQPRVNLKAEKFSLPPNEILIRVGETINIHGQEIYIRDITSSNVLIDVMGVILKERIQESKSKKFDNIEISNIKLFPKGSKIDSYAIIKIEKI